MREENNGRRQRFRKGILLGAAVAAAVVVVLTAVLSIWIRPPQVPDPYTPKPLPGAVGSVSEMEDWEVEGPDTAQSGRKPGVYTFLVAGLDVASGATDTMLLLSFDSNEKAVYGLNLPRDTIMNVSYKTSKRLNTIYTINKGSDKATQAKKGMAALGEHVAKLTGITPDFYVLLEWEAIGELVDAVGGVEFEVPFDMDYDDPYQNPPLHIHQKAGLRTLSGDDAMQVIRWRQNNTGASPGDIGRLAIQQDFLKSVVKKCLQPGIFLKIPALAEIFMNNVKTDLTIGNILAFAKMAYGMDASTGVSFQTAPLAADAWYKGAAMVTLDGAGILKIVNNGMNPYLRDIQLSDLELIVKKADGTYGVTGGELADPEMGVPKKTEPAPEVPEKPEPEVPEQPEAPGLTEEPEDIPPQQEQPDQPDQSTEEPLPSGEPDPEQEPVQSEQEAGNESEENTEQPGVDVEIPEWMIPVTP